MFSINITHFEIWFHFRYFFTIFFISMKFLSISIFFIQNGNRSQKIQFYNPSYNFFSYKILLYEGTDEIYYPIGPTYIAIYKTKGEVVSGITLNSFMIKML